ncbi:MAG: hypothetical protein RI894_2211 [Bacteroidota bacterium]|jgi:chorismate dehydratase
MRITAVSYLNTKPLLYGIFHTEMDSKLQISLDIPSVCAQKLLSGEADLGLIPVGALPDLPNYQIVSDYCIGAVGAVKTVCIYSDVPLQTLTHIYLDFHSRSSVRLAQILLQEYWQHQVSFLPTDATTAPVIGGTVGAVLIGDKTFGLEGRYQYTYDLAEAWQNHTGLPFVFAVWASVKKVEDDFIKNFNEAMRIGLAHIPQLCQLIPSPDPTFSLHDYYTKYISYELDAAKYEGLSLFLSKL